MNLFDLYSLILYLVILFMLNKESGISRKKEKKARDIFELQAQIMKAIESTFIPIKKGSDKSQKQNLLLNMHGCG